MEGATLDRYLHLESTDSTEDGIVSAVVTEKFTM